VICHSRPSRYSAWKIAFSAARKEVRKKEGEEQAAKTKERRGIKRIMGR